MCQTMSMPCLRKLDEIDWDMPEMAQGQQLLDGPNPREDELRTAGCAILPELSIFPELNEMCKQIGIVK